MSILIESMSVDLWNIGMKLMKTYMREHLADKQVRRVSYCSMHPTPKRLERAAAETCVLWFFQAPFEHCTLCP